MTKGSLVVFFATGNRGAALFFATSNRRSSSVKNETYKYVVFILVGSFGTSG